MRTLIAIAVLLPGMAIAAEQAKKPASATTIPATTTPAATNSASTAPLSGNPCAQYGAGFVQVKGTSTCVKAGGYLRTEIAR